MDTFTETEPNPRLGVCIWNRVQCEHSHTMCVPQIRFQCKKVPSWTQCRKFCFITVIIAMNCYQFSPLHRFSKKLIGNIVLSRSRMFRLRKTMPTVLKADTTAVSDCCTILCILIWPTHFVAPLLGCLSNEKNPKAPIHSALIFSFSLKSTT